MEPVWVVIIAVVAFVGGLVVGNRSANEAWRIRAGYRGYGLTPHHYDGEFYYVIPESEFCRDYQHKPVAWDIEEGE